jgi:hypothetical protein
MWESRGQIGPRLWQSLGHDPGGEELRGNLSSSPCHVPSPALRHTLSSELGLSRSQFSLLTKGEWPEVSIGHWGIHVS